MKVFLNESFTEGRFPLFAMLDSQLFVGFTKSLHVVMLAVFYLNSMFNKKQQKQNENFNF